MRSVIVDQGCRKPGTQQQIKGLSGFGRPTIRPDLCVRIWRHIRQSLAVSQKKMKLRTFIESRPYHCSVLIGEERTCDGFNFRSGQSYSKRESLSSRTPLYHQPDLQVLVKRSPDISTQKLTLDTQ